MVASLPPPPPAKSIFSISDARQTNLGSIEFFLSRVGHPHHRLKLRTASVTLFASAEYFAFSDSSSVVTGDGGIRVAF